MANTSTNTAETDVRKQMLFGGLLTGFLGLDLLANDGQLTQQIAENAGRQVERATSNFVEHATAQASNHASLWLDHLMNSL